MAAQALVCANESMGQALSPAQRWALPTGWENRGASVPGGRNLLVDLQIKVEVVDEEVHGNELAVEQEGLNKRTTSLSRGELAEAV